MNEAPVRFGVIGYGLFGTHHARAVANCEQAELVAVSAKSQDSRDRAAEDHPTAALYEDYRELLARDDIDVVNIVTPNKMHFEVAEAALKAGKHILLEKPMAIRLDECERLIALANEQSRTIAIGHELRLSSLWGGVRQLIEDGAIGDVQYVMVELSRFPYRQGSEGWRYDIDRVGNWILEEPIHFFDLARWYLRESGEPNSIYARAIGRHPEHPELQDNFSATISYENGSYALVTQTLAAFGHHQTAKISGTRGSIWAYWSAADARSDSPQFGLTYGLGDDTTEVTFDKPTGKLLELADQVPAVARAVPDGGPPPCTGEDGRWSTLLCLAAQRSVDDDQVISLPKFAGESERLDSSERHPECGRDGPLLTDGNDCSGIAGRNGHLLPLLAVVGIC